MRLTKALVMTAFAAALFCSRGQTAPVATGCMMVAYPGSLNGIPSYLDATTTFDSGPFANGVYDVFCANRPFHIGDTDNYSVVIYGLTDPAVGALGIVTHPENLDLVEYILNQNYTQLTSVSGGGPFNSDDIQAAIWTLLDDVSPETSISIVYRPAFVADIVADAQANGEGFSATSCNQIKAYVVNPVATACGQAQALLNSGPIAQPLIFGVPIPCGGSLPLTLECVSDAIGEVGQAYSSFLVASGGKPAYTFSITVGVGQTGLPPGLTLNPGTGEISGTPTAWGVFSFTATVTDTLGEGHPVEVANTVCSITIEPPEVTLQCASQGAGKVGVPFVAAFLAAGGTGQYTFSFTPDPGQTLPPGLSFSPTGGVTGTPTSAGTFNFTVTVTDTDGNTGVIRTASVSCGVTISPPTCPPVSLGCVSTGTGTVGTFYTASLSVSGGTAPYTFSIISGSLPPGLTLNKTTGAITGTPTAGGTFSFTAKVVDSSGKVCACNSSDTVCCSIKINSNCSPVTLGCVSTTTGTVGTTYTATLNATGGTAPYTFSIVSGSLPNGLSLNPSTGTITGKPTTAGTFSFTAKVIDSSGTACGCYRYDTVCCSIKITGTSTCACLVHGDTATIGYWNNSNGQALIKSLNGGPTSKQLANWLASNFPYLYGAYAGADNLTGKSNADVAALFKTFFAISGQKVKAQTLAAALAVYVTNSSLAGNTATAAGFNVSSTGTGAKCYNVGCNGCAIGLDKDKSYSVMTLLKQADYRKKQGCFNATAFNAIFDGINVKGDRL